MTQGFKPSKPTSGDLFPPTVPHLLHLLNKSLTGDHAFKCPRLCGTYYSNNHEDSHINKPKPLQPPDFFFTKRPKIYIRKKTATFTNGASQTP